MGIHLIRHGEVDNPDHIVYGGLPGFTLSDRGCNQAISAGQYVRQFPISRIITSPLERAVDTAALLTGSSAIEVEIDERLGEWELSTRWAGVGWEELNRAFPGELEAYLSHPDDLPFSPESLVDVAARVSAAVIAWSDLDEDVAFVSHQDPIHAARLLLTGSSFGGFHTDKPEHCSVSSLDRTGGTWSMNGYWAPAQ
jgi:broad specificity phosphatase PhoE